MVNLPSYVCAGDRTYARSFQFMRAELDLCAVI